MSRHCVRFPLALAAGVATTLVASVSHALPVTELLGEGGPVMPLKNAAMITKTDVGYRYQAGQQNSHLVVTQVGRRVRFADTGTSELRRLPAACRGEKVAVGVAASCRLPLRFNKNNPMFLEIWPRLGNDFVRGSTLSKTFRLWVLADAGRDTVFGGAGNDFINGAQDNDVARGGAGRDWIRTGIGKDQIWGDNGNDKLVGADGADTVRGGQGNDEVRGGAGNDQLWGNSGDDKVACGTGTDGAWLRFRDRASDCESMERS